MQAFNTLHIKQEVNNQRVFFLPKRTLPVIVRKVKQKQVCVAQNGINQQFRGLASGIANMFVFVKQFTGIVGNALSIRLQTPVSDEFNEQLRKMSKQARFAYSVAPFAAASAGADTLMLVTKAVASFIKLYLLLLFLRVLLSWFPNFEWESQPWLALRQVTDPYLNLFRGLVPPLLGSIDFTPLVGFMILQFLGGLLDVTDENEDVW
eukprot:TRINITY_DN7447_c0_g1_i3.p1 TRINITY_DN7447_c0_g1~~TRINITY_DN7447_c0_g1_i3.p1  ORF type:complete len:207 (+),score=13.43 TRINITY_DN7447_c0_g1_i3:92-712(+)